LHIGGTPLRINCRDALASDTVTAGTLFEDLGEQRESAAYVVGNHPYGKVHSSDIRIAAYKHTVHGHANSYGLFLALAVSKLKEGGRLGFVVPRSFASGLCTSRTSADIC
jgi:type I restriction-modification system DNA methylase subunit